MKPRDWHKFQTMIFPGKTCISSSVQRNMLSNFRFLNEKRKGAERLQLQQLSAFFRSTMCQTCWRGQEVSISTFPLILGHCTAVLCNINDNLGLISTMIRHLKALSIFMFVSSPLHHPLVWKQQDTPNGCGYARSITSLEASRQIMRWDAQEDGTLRGDNVTETLNRY